MGEAAESGAGWGSGAGRGERGDGSTDTIAIMSPESEDVLLQSREQAVSLLLARPALAGGRFCSGHPRRVNLCTMCGGLHLCLTRSAVLIDLLMRQATVNA